MTKLPPRLPLLLPLFLRFPRGIRLAFSLVAFNRVVSLLCDPIFCITFCQRQDFGLETSTVIFPLTESDKFFPHTSNLSVPFIVVALT